MFLRAEHTRETGSSHYSLHVAVPWCSEQVVTIASLCRMRKYYYFSLNLIFMCKNLASCHLDNLVSSLGPETPVT